MMRVLTPGRFLASYGVVLALALIILFGWLRYDNFLGSFNVLSVLRYNSMFALVALGMCFVIMTGGIDLSVGSVAALSSVCAAYASPYGLVPGLLAGLAAGLSAGLVNGVLVTGLKIMPFIATLATMLAASGTALLLAGNQSVSVSYDTAFIALGQGNLVGLPVPGAHRAAGLCAGFGGPELHKHRARHPCHRRKRGRLAHDGAAGTQDHLSGLSRLRRLRWPFRGDSCCAVRGRPADRRRRLGAFRDCRCRCRRHIADRWGQGRWVRHWPGSCCWASSLPS